MTFLGVKRIKRFVSVTESVREASLKHESTDKFYR